VIVNDQDVINLTDEEDNICILYNMFNHYVLNML
jgi:hypothetical protein